MFRNNEGLPRLIQSLDANARAIDVTFATAGQQLGEGLTLFQALNEQLAALSSELAGSEIEQARTALHRLAGELRTLNDDLSAETSALQDLSIHSHNASQALERLLEHMRLITILARSARIEAISIPMVGSDFGDFAGEIGTLTTQAQRTIERCARDQAQLCSLLDSALTAQREFEGRYGRSLAALAGKLGQTLAEVIERQRRSVALTEEAAAISGRITLATGGAIIALQSGDSMRQRLEHAISGLRLGEAPGAVGDEDGETRAACVNVLLRLQSAQLEAASGALGPDVEEINSALILLDRETTQLIDLVRSLYRGGNGGAASFLVELEADLAEASVLLGRCDIARAGVDRVTEAVASVLDTCQGTVEALAATAANIVLIGMNAGLRAARIGTGGRSLVVIAQELKFAADQVSTDSRKLTPAFTQMQAASSGLKCEGRLDAAYFASRDLTMRSSLATMRHSGDRLGASLDELLREGERFGAVIEQAGLSFSSTGAMRDLITGAAHELLRAAGAQLPEAHLLARVGDFIEQEIWPNYTMAAERQIHTAVLEACGFVTGARAPVAVPAEADVDEFLF
ncbi:hypothetical protein [Bosea sp. 2RAB26]|uniref:hypothetical protein n=1 Tax=Bosea sp. 2RAB26 TaxID=3237476 RepID=UPI003F8E4424